MKNVIVINEKSIVIDGKELVDEVLGWSYSRQGGDMILVMNRLVLVHKEGEPEPVGMMDDKGACFYQCCYVNPNIKIEIDSTRPQIIQARTKLN